MHISTEIKTTVRAEGYPYHMSTGYLLLRCDLNFRMQHVCGIKISWGNLHLMQKKINNECIKVHSHSPRNKKRNTIWNKVSHSMLNNLLILRALFCPVHQIWSYCKGPCTMIRVPTFSDCQNTMIFPVF